MPRRYWYALAGAALAYAFMTKRPRTLEEPVSVEPEADPWWKIW